jgi:UDP-N-acetylmuramoyl-tripeptide--D-alanyl-D-alanine ligase
MKIKLSEIAEITGGNLVGEDVCIDEVSINTRQMQPGDLFIAIRGDNFDGHDFVEDARQAGAKAALLQRPVDSALPQIIVDDTRLALAEIAGALRKSLSVKVAGVTGSNGKTTVKEMIAAILAVSDTVLSTQGNLNNDIGVPLTLLRLKHNHRYAVIEMGANHRGEIAYTSRYAAPDVVVITNAGAAHIEGFGDLQGVAETKGELISSLSEQGVAVLNRDDDYYRFWLELAGKRKTVSFGLNNKADLWADKISSTIINHQFVTQFQVHAGKQSIDMQLQLAGTHNVKNALAAAAVCSQFDISLEQIKQGLSLMQPVIGRLQPLIGSKDNIVIDDTYNANPASLKAGVEVLMQCQGEPWLVLGAFGELGDGSVDMHVKMGEMCRDMGIVKLFATGPDAKECVKAFGVGGQYFNSQDELIETLTSKIKGHETILVKGSRAQKMENVVAALVNNFRD